MSAFTNASRGRAARILGAAGLASLTLAGAALAAPLKDAQEVVVTNGPDNPVVATLAGSPGVSITGTPTFKLDTSAGALPVAPQGTTAVAGTVGIDPAQNTVKVTSAEVPFQAILHNDSESSPGFMCKPIPDPGPGLLVRLSGVRLRAMLNPTHAENVRAFLRPSSQTLDQFVDIPVELDNPTNNPAFRQGTLSDLDLFHGTVSEPVSQHFNYTLCLRHLTSQNGSIDEFNAVVTGTIVSAS